MGVVVTGAAGFLGSVLVDLLAGRGEHVVAVDRREVAPRRGVVPLRAELSEHDSRLAAALRAADAVWHLAGAPGVRDASSDPAARRGRDNVRAAERVLAATPAETPLVVTSSSSVYGGSRGRPSREDDPVRPRGGYAASKVVVEAACRARLRAGGRTVVARPFTLVGEGQRADMALARWVHAARQGRPLMLLGGADRTRDFTDVRAAAAALAELAVARDADGVVNVGSGRPQQLGDLLAAVARATGRALDVRTVQAAPEEPADTWACTARLARLVGPPAATDLDDVVARLTSRLPAPARPRIAVPA